jgi:Domain of Unknown Function (DUF1080)
MKKVIMSLLLLSLFVSVPLSASAKVALFENFSTGTLGSRWSTYSHGGVTAEVVDFEGNKVLKMAGSGVAVVGDPTWTDYTVEGDVYVYDASYWAYAAGVLFRGNGQFESFYQTDAYVYQGRPGELQFEKWNNGQAWQHLSDDYGHPFTPGVWHHFKIICEGQHFQSYVDGTLTLDYTDPNAHLAGQVGFRTWGAGAYFDNLMVTTKEELPPGVVLSEDFSEGVLDPRWSAHDQGGFGYEIVNFNGKNVLKLTNSGVVSIGDPAWTDYTAEADVYVFDPWYGAYAAGLLFRTQGPLSNWYDMNTYVMEGRPYVIELEKWTKSQDWQDLRDNYSIPFTPNSWHHFKAVCVGPRILLYMDDALVSDYTDAQPHLAGQVGLRAYAVGAYYGNLKVTLNNDITPPTTTSAVAGTVGTAGWYTSDATVTLTASDAQSGVREIRYSIDGGQEVTVPANTASITLSAEGVHDLTYYAIDSAVASNAETPKSLKVSIDKIAPVTTAVVSGINGNNGWYTSAATITLAANDGISGVARTEYSFNNASWATYTTPVTISNDGTSIVYYRSVDVAGNSEGAQSVIVKVDNTAPAGTVSPSPAYVAKTGVSKLFPVTINGSWNDATSGLQSVTLAVTDEYGLRNQTIPNFTFGGQISLDSYVKKGDSDGKRIYTVTVTAYDIAGNQQSATTTVTAQAE